MLRTTSRAWVWVLLAVPGCARESPPRPDTVSVPAPASPAPSAPVPVAPIAFSASAAPVASSVPVTPAAPVVPVASVPPVASATPKGGGECTKDADCRLFSNYCNGCKCDVLKKTAADPRCAGPAVNCVVDPCGRAHPRCIASKCAREDDSM